MERRYRLGTVSARTADSGMVERRSATRELQFLLAGYIWAEDASVALACTVRDISLTGARMELDYQGIKPRRAALRLPRQFTIDLCAFELELDCELVWQDDRNFGVRFVGEPRPSTWRFS